MIKIQLQVNKNHLKKNKIKIIHVDESISAYDTLIKLKLINSNPCKICINNFYYSELELMDYFFKNDDVIVLSYTINFTVAFLFAKVTWATIIATFLINTAISLAVNMLLTSLMKKKTKEDKNKDGSKKDINVYGISASSNDTRPYEPMPLVVGSTRVYPDFNQQPFLDYVLADPIKISNSVPFMLSEEIPEIVLEDALLSTHTRSNKTGVGDDPSFTLVQTWWFFGDDRTYGEPYTNSNITMPFTWVVLKTDKYPYTEPLDEVIDPPDETTNEFMTFEMAGKIFRDLKPYTYSGWIDDNHFRAIQYDPVTDTPIGTYPIYDTYDFTFPYWMAGLNTEFGDYTPIAYLAPLSIDYPIVDVEDFPVIQYFGYNQFQKAQRLVEVFTNGFGDYENSDFRIGSTKIERYKNVIINDISNDYNNPSVELNFSIDGSFTESPDGLSIQDSVDAILSRNYELSDGVYRFEWLPDLKIMRVRYPSFLIGMPYYYNDIVMSGNQNLPEEGASLFKHIVNTVDKSNATYDEIYYGRYPDNVAVEIGGDIKRNASSVDEQAYIVRSCLKDYCYGFEININGSLFFLNKDTGKVQTHTTSVKVYYREKSDTITYPPSSPWIDLGEVTLSNDTTTEYRLTKYFELDTIYKKIEVALIKVSLDPTDTNYNEDLKLSTINFFCKQGVRHVGQNMYALEIAADSQINGNQDKFSYLSSGKTWVISPTGSTEFMPEVDGLGWEWIETRNPAYWALHFMLGMYINEDLDASHPLYGMGINLGLGDGNFRSLYGCSIELDDIDLSSLHSWANYCDSKSLYIDKLIDGNSDCANVLDKICSVGRCFVDRDNFTGKFIFACFKKEDPIQAIFGASNIKANTFSITYPQEILADQFVMSFPNRDNDFTTEYIRVNVPLVTDVTDIVNVDNNGITNYIQAFKETKLLSAAILLDKMKVSFETDMRGLLLQRGAVVKLGQDLVMWSVSGRLTSCTIVGGIVTSIKLSRDIIIPPTESIFIYISNPFGELKSYECTAIDEFNLNVLDTGVDGAWLDENAPFYINSNFDENAESRFNESHPEDFIFLAQPTESNNRFRVMSVEYDENFHSKLTLLADPIEYYDYEDSDPTININYENSVKSYIDGMGLVYNSGTARIFWNNINCLGGVLNISKNGGAYTPITVNNNYIDIVCDLGDTFDINAMPVNLFNTTYTKETTFNLEVV